MACVIRVKRRIDDDPAEALFLSCKRRRESDGLELKSVLSFAGTICSRDEPVSSHIKEAIRQKKLHKGRHPHSANFKHSVNLPEVTSKLRKDTEQTSRANRYRITCSRRALDLKCLDEDAHQDEAHAGEECDDSPEKPVSLSRLEYDKDVSDSCATNKKQPALENKEDSSVSPSSSNSDYSGTTDISKELSNDQRIFKKRVVSEANKTSGSSAAGDSKRLVKEDQMFCIFDVENDVDDEAQKELDQKTSSGITMNNIPMQSICVSTPPSSEFVYDLYYTHKNLSDLDQEAVVTVQALCDELVCEPEDENSERDSVCDDEDDSNDENNWRADYPDEDPRYFENADEDYDYAEDMVDTNFLRDDDGDLLAYWMDTRCKVDVASDDSEDEYEADKGDSSQSSDE